MKKFIDKYGNDCSDTIAVIAKIRHEFTNYNKLAGYYQYYRYRKKELNGVISNLLKGKIDIPQFKERVATIESFVDLSKKKNQKRFLEEEVTRLRVILPEVPTPTLKKFAKNNLSSVLHGRNIRNGF